MYLCPAHTVFSTAQILHKIENDLYSKGIGAILPFMSLKFFTKEFIANPWDRRWLFSSTTVLHRKLQSSSLQNVLFVDFIKCGCLDLLCLYNPAWVLNCLQHTLQLNDFWSVSVMVFSEGCFVEWLLEEVVEDFCALIFYVLMLLEWWSWGWPSFALWYFTVTNSTCAFLNRYDNSTLCYHYNSTKNLFLLFLANNTPFRMRYCCGTLLTHGKTLLWHG